MLTKLAPGRELRTMAEIKWFKDLSTAQGEVSHRNTTIRDYLKSLDIYDPSRKTVDFASDGVAIAIQRSEIAIKGNHIKSEMLSSLLRGGTIPALSLHEDSNGQLSILDGLQRTHVLAFGLENLQRWHEGKTTEIPDFVQKMMTKLGDRLLSLNDYLARPVFLTVYRSLSESEMVNLFVVLNVGQQRVSVRHLLEALNHPLEALFSKWDIMTRTEKADRQADKPRGRRPKNAELPPYRLEYLVNTRPSLHYQKSAREKPQGRSRRLRRR